MSNSYNLKEALKLMLRADKIRKEFNPSQIEFEQVKDDYNTGVIKQKN